MVDREGKEISLPIYLCLCCPHLKVDSGEAKRAALAEENTELKQTLRSVEVRTQPYVRLHDLVHTCQRMSALGPNAFLVTRFLPPPLLLVPG